MGDFDKLVEKYKSVRKLSTEELWKELYITKICKDYITKMDNLQDVTIVILTKNEEVNLPNCLKSVRGFAKRCVIVDSYSNDRTKEIALEYGADFYEHKFENYARQFNWALDNTDINTKWTFRLDADERLTPALCAELAKLMLVHDSDEVNGITMSAWLYFMGKKLKHNKKAKHKLMLFKTGIGRIEDRKMDEHTILSCGTSVMAHERFLHYDFKNMTFWINKMNWYATREMQDYFDYINGKEAGIEGNDKGINTTRNRKFGIYYKMPIFLRAILLFLFTYFKEMRFLDGKEGFIYTFMYSCWYRLLVDSKIYEQMKFNKPFGKTGDLK